MINLNNLKIKITLNKFLSDWKNMIIKQFKLYNKLEKIIYSG